MDTKSQGTCSSCGARMEENAEQCALCGWQVGQIDHDMTSASEEADEVNGSDLPDADASSESGDVGGAEGPFCHMCGWENPAGARFCSACGTKLQEVAQTEKAASTPAKAKIKGAKKASLTSDLAEKSTLEPIEIAQEAPNPIQPVHLVMMAAAGLLIVAALYMITVFSRRAFPEVEPTQAQAQTEQSQSGNVANSDALPADVADRIATLESEAEGLTGEALILKKREMVSILASVNRADKAATIQEEVAGLSGTSDDWFQAGHFYYDLMDSQSGQARFDAAIKATTAYESGLEINPDDLNIRTALAMAYLNTRAPMQGVQQIRQVLDTDPDHLQGNFYYGVMLMQINRVDQAKAQFERVKELVGPESPVYQQADMMLQNLN